MYKVMFFLFFFFFFKQKTAYEIMPSLVGSEMCIRDSDDGDEHKQAADQREQEELDGRVDAPRASPDADDEVHRHQHDLPAHVEQEEVGSQKDSAHPHLQQEQRDEEAQLAVLDVVPAADDHDDAEQRGEEEAQGGD